MFREIWKQKPSHVRRIWSICAFDQTRCAFDQMRCAFSQLRKPNPNLTVALTLTLIPLQVRCAIDQILRNSSNAAQLINWSAAQGAARLVKRAIDHMRATAIPSEAIYSRKIKFLSKVVVRQYSYCVRHLQKVYLKNCWLKWKTTPVDNFDGHFPQACPSSMICHRSETGFAAAISPNVDRTGQGTVVARGTIDGSIWPRSVHGRLRAKSAHD